MKGKNIKKIISISLAAALVGVLGACHNNTAVKSESLTIATSFYPLYIATLNVTKGIEGVEVVNMTPPITGCLHDYSVTPKDMQLLEEAEVFVINGAGMESFMDEVTSQMKNLTIINASDGIPLLEGDEEEGDNPHVWVSITHAITQVQNIAQQLSQIDPAHSAQYQKNSEAYSEKLEEKKQEMHESLETISNRDIVTFHEAFPYFAKEFNLNIVGVIEREPGSEPSAKELAETIEQVRALEINALFAEPQYPSKAAETIASETGAKVYVLDPAVTGPMEEDAYLNIMSDNLKVLEEALK